MAEGLPNIDPFVTQQLENYLAGLQDLLGSTSVELPERLVAETIDHGGQRFPAKVSGISSDGTARLYYDRAAIDRKVDIFSNPELRGDIERYYLLGGLVVSALDQNMDFRNRQQVHELYTFFTKASQLTDPETGEIEKSDAVIDEHKETLREVIFSASHGRKVYLNTLRFMVGALRHMPCMDSEVQLRMKDAGEQELRNSLQFLRERGILRRGYAGDEDDGRGYGFDITNDAIDEFSIALVFPMGILGIQRIIEIVSEASDKDSLDPEEEIFDPQELTDNEGGYHVEG
jgi:hypothetical protein